MKRLFALLLLLCSPALYAQVDFTNAVNVPNTVVNSNFENCSNNTQAPNCGGVGWGGWVEGPGFQPGDFTSNFGSREYAFSFVNGVLSQNIYLGNFETNAFNFTFSFSLNNSCRNSIGGYCENVDGPIDQFSAKVYFYDQNGLNNQFTFLSGAPSTANIVCNFEVLGLCIGGYSAQDQWQQFGWYSSVQSNSLFDYARIEFTGRDVGFWGGLYGPRIDNVNLQINYLPPLYPTSGGDAGMNVAAPGSDYIFIYKGNDPVLFSQLAIKGQDLVGWTAVGTNGQDLEITSISQPDPDYLFLYTDGVPVSGTFYSFQEQPPTVDCVLSPFDPTCIIDTLGIDDGTIDYSDPEQVLASLETDTETNTETDTGSDDGTDDGSSDGTEVVEEDEEEVLVADDATEETDLEEMLADQEAIADEEETVTEETDVADEVEKVAEPVMVATYRELTDEEKAAILADAIAKNTLESALAVASDANAASSNSTSTAATTTQTDSNTSRTSTSQNSSSSLVAQETTTIEMKEEEQKVEAVESTDSGSDTLELGRQMGKEALASTMSQTEQSATESVSQAESIAMSSSETQTTIVATNDSSQTTVAEDNNISTSNKIDDIDDGSKRETQQVVFDDTSSGSTTTETEQQIVAQTDTTGEIESNTTVVETGSDQTQEEKVEVLVADTQTTEQADTFAELMQLDIKPVIEEKADGDLEFIQQIVAASNEQKQEETNNSGFNEDEKVTIANDPALANAFNLAPNVTNLEVAGVLNNKQEEKSDAEKRADEVVAANAKEQEEINKNYMDADQSGIVAAMSDGTDVSAYRTAMLRDNNNWYKPEDIYKNIVIKDNVRGSYFLEKGNTDTYKKMVEEQYK